MLSRVTKSTNSGVVVLQQIARRHFDYLAVANRVDNGESVETQIASDKAARAQDASRFSWDYIKWFEQYSPEALPSLNSTRAKYQQFEQYIGGQGVSGGNKVDFNGFRERIADPKFVDELEVEFNVNLSTTKSISNMKTLESWKESSVNSFQKECENNGDLIWAPMTQQERNESLEAVEQAEARRVKLGEYLVELEKDYEQVDAERMVYGQETTQMRYSEHPQYAETIEDRLAAHQTYGDYIMMPWNNNQLRHERLASMQDENRRKVFLERFEKGSKIYNGLDVPEQTGGGGH